MKPESLNQNAVKYRPCLRSHSYPSGDLGFISAGGAFCMGVRAKSAYEDQETCDSLTH